MGTYPELSAFFEAHRFRFFLGISLSVLLSFVCLMYVFVVQVESHVAMFLLLASVALAAALNYCIFRTARDLRRFSFRDRLLRLLLMSALFSVAISLSIPFFGMAVRSQAFIQVALLFYGVSSPLTLHLPALLAVDRTRMDQL